MAKKRTRRNLGCVGRTRIMKPHRSQSASLSHKCCQGESRRTERGETKPRPFLLDERAVYWMAANISFTAGVFSFLSAFASIWRILSLVTERLCPTCSNVKA